MALTADIGIDTGMTISHQTSLMALSMDILSILEDIDDIVDDFDFPSSSSDEYSDDNKDDSNNNKLNHQNYNNDDASSVEKKDDPKSNGLIAPNFGSLININKIKKLKELNMKKLAQYEEHEHSLSTVDENTNPGMLSHDDLFSDDMSSAMDTPSSYDNAPTPLLPARSRAKAKTQENPLNIESVTPPTTTIQQLQQSLSIDKDKIDNYIAIPDDNIHNNNDDHKNNSIMMQKVISYQIEDLFVQRQVKEIARLLYDLVDIDEHKYKYHTYTKCFVAKEALSILISHNLCLHQHHGIKIMREMTDKKIIHHIFYENGKPFSGNNQLFQFYLDDQHINNDDDDKNKKSGIDLDEAFGIVKTPTFTSLNDSNKSKKIKHRNGTNSSQEFGRLPSELLGTMRLHGGSLAAAKIRHKSTITQFADVANTMVELPELSGWMDKKSAKGFRSWQKRWIIVRRTHMLWSKKLMNTENPLDPNERRKFNNSITLLTIKAVRPINSKRKRKFDLVTAAKTYHFKCSNAKQRELWLNGLQKHLSVLAESMKFLRQSFIFRPEIK